MIDTTGISSSKLSNSLGDIKHFDVVQNGIKCLLDNAFLDITIYNQNVINVCIRTNELKDSNPYSVISQPTSENFEVSDTGEAIVICTGHFSLEITKSPARLTFKTKEGKIINQDEPGFGTSFIGEQLTTYKKLQEGERFIGLGEKTGPLDRRGSGYQHWNTDHFGYGPEADPLYCSTPFYIGIHNNLNYGIYLDNSYKSHFNFGASNDRFSSFSVDSGDMDYYFIYDDNVGGILNNYSQLTGLMPMPPIWSIGYQQCRYSYYPDKEVERVAQTFRDKDIPADVIVLDIHYMEKYKIFTWDGKSFPNPKALIDHLKELGFHIVVMCDPGIKIEDGYPAYESGTDHDVFVKYPDGTSYSGSVWPGLCHFPDFTMEKTRTWWAEHLKSYTSLGIDGYWNDMNEIATWGQMLPELIEFNFEGDKNTARKGRNIYGFQMCRATYEGTKASLGGKRPFNLTRAGFAGVQRYAAVWTGDNVASDEHMMVGVRLVNSMGLTGIAFAGYDVGGFVGNSNEQLFARWIQIGAFSPFFRGHSTINTRASEPWSYGEEVEEISKNYISLRYKLMPYLYSCFHEATQNGMPVARSLAINYTHDANIYDAQFENQYLFGPSVLVAPVESFKNLAKVYLPDGEWYDLLTDQYYEGNQEIVAECGIERLPVFVKGSGILTVCPKAKTNTTNLGDVLEVHVYNGNQGNSFTYYEDDGVSFDYQSKNYYQRDIAFDPQSRSITISPATGNFESKRKEIHICLHGFDNQEYSLNGNSVWPEEVEYRFIDPISNFDPFGNETGAGLKINQIRMIKANNDHKEIRVSW